MCVWRRYSLWLIPLLLSVCLTLPMGGRVATSEGAVTYHRDVAPIIDQNCTVCHRPEGPGPFNLVTFEDVRKRARQNAKVTSSGFMPPWLPAQSDFPFANERRLGQAQIDTIRRWVEQGAPEGSPADAPSLPRFEKGWQMGRPDLVVRMDQPYTLPASKVDIFRNFVIPAGRR